MGCELAVFPAATTAPALALGVFMLRLGAFVELAVFITSSVVAAVTLAVFAVAAVAFAATVFAVDVPAIVTVGPVATVAFCVKDLVADGAVTCCPDRRALTGSHFALQRPFGARIVGASVLRRGWLTGH